MKERPYSEYNAQPVLERLEAMIERGCSREIRQVYDDLSIFDWWPERLTITHMKQMRTFLKEAIKLGYTGYVCFKVGAHGCANGMWACVNPTTDGHSPKGDTIYRSFTPDYTYWSFQKDGEWLPADGEYDSLKTAKMLEEAIAKHQEEKQNEANA
jgi:hypothetical protein